jgi:hypothetical protein
MMKKSKYMARGGAAKKTKYMAKGGATKGGIKGAKLKPRNPEQAKIRKRILARRK